MALRKVAKDLMRQAFRSPLVQWGVRLLDRMPDGGPQSLRVLTYHRIDEVTRRPDLDPSLISATPEQFALQIDWLSRDFDLVSVTDVLGAIQGGPSLPRRAVLLTFDDAYLDFETQAWPILRERSAAAALFVPTAYPDNCQLGFWWDRLYKAIVRSEYTGPLETPLGRFSLSDPATRERLFRNLKKRLKSNADCKLRQAVDDICLQCDSVPSKPSVMGWGSLRKLAKSNVALVPHTHTHPLLDRVTPEVARDEVRLSRETLKSETGQSLPVFAYPSGHFDEHVAAIVREEGFQLAFTTIRGINDLRSFDPVRARRNNVGRFTPDSLIRLQMTGMSRYWNQRMPSRYAHQLADEGIDETETWSRGTAGQA